MKIYRPEHPRPDMKRAEWLNLNGEWDFDFDFGISKEERGWFKKGEWKQKINVPFCPESSLSGIGCKDFMPAVWYHRSFQLTGEQKQKKILLHFGAVDYECRVWINGCPAGSHKGGYSSFCLDITDLAVSGTNEITVEAIDDNRSPLSPHGKQSSLFFSHDCDYTRTTGIWQTVWLEFLPFSHISSFRIYPNISDCSITVQACVNGHGTLCAEAFYKGQSCGSASAPGKSGNISLILKLSELHLWEPGHGRLYDLRLSFCSDTVESYFGMREICIEGEKVLINGKPVFQRLVLDQGFYPDGIYTAPDEETLCRDIRLSMAAGFNGARLHQKAFEPEFLYHCDRLGYIVWGEMANWGLDYSNPGALKAFLPEWMELLARDFNHPAIIGWCPFNETWDYQGRRQDDDLLKIIYLMTKQFDTTRPCIDTSGNFHVITDIYDLHDYEQDCSVFRNFYREFSEGGPLTDTHSSRQTPQAGKPVFISEYGGIKWDVEKNYDNGWGYGKDPETEEAFIVRYRGLTDALLDNPHMFGFCYTQLYDVEQEKNGLYTYDRTPKFDMNIFKKINSRKAAYENQN